MEERATSKILVVALIIYDFSKSFAGIQYLQHGSIRSMCPTHYKKALKNAQSGRREDEEISPEQQSLIPNQATIPHPPKASVTLRDKNELLHEYSYDVSD